MNKNIANDLAEATIQRFLSDNRDLIALIKNLSVAELRERLSAAMELNPEYTEDILLYSDPECLSQTGYAGRVARESFERAMYAGIAKSWLHVHRRGILRFAIKPLTPEAVANIEAIEVAAGERQPAPPPPPPKSSAELLEEEVRVDWKKLPTDKLRKKINANSAYKAAFDRLMAADQLDSVATSLHDGSKGL